MKMLKSLKLKDYFFYYAYTKSRAFAEYFVFTLPNLKKLYKIKKLKDSKKGQKAFVFANGPSLNKIDAEKIKKYQDEGFDVFAGNSFINTEFGKIVEPNYYVFSDPAHFGVYSTTTPEVAIKNCINDYEKIVSREIPLFVPHRYCRKVSYKKAYVFNDTFDIFSKNVKDVTKRRPYVSMTLYKALSIACYMGYEEIYICGFDNDYFKSIIVDENNNVMYEENHFYDKVGNKNNRMQSPLFSTTAEALISFHVLFLGLEMFKQENIINLDPSGLADCFVKKHNLDIYC